MRSKGNSTYLFLCLLIGGLTAMSHLSAMEAGRSEAPLQVGQPIEKNSKIDPAELVSGIDSVRLGDTLRTSVRLFFRWDKDVIEKDYMSNNESLLLLEELLSSKNVRALDSIKIIAYASPEGHPVYNQKLSERRGREVKKVLLWKFPHLEGQRIVYTGLGENWVGLEELVKGDLHVPSRNKVLHLLTLPLSLLERDKRLQAMDGGIPYRYIFNKYYKQLRNASSIYLSIITRPKLLAADIADPPVWGLQHLVAQPPMPAIGLVAEERHRYIRPFAVKSNLLFDALIMPNIELEFPVGKRFSLLGEWVFPWWGSLGNAGGVSPVPVYSESFTMQMLSGGLEARYWFGRSKSLDRRARRWGDYNPLNGWFVGLYAGAGLYDFQFGGDGIQGEFYIASGVSAGYAHPIGKYFHLEYSLGLGYMSTRYYCYTPLDGHKVVKVRPDGRYDRRQQSWVGPTKMKISLVWIPRFKVNR